MISENNELRGRLQLSRLLHGVEMGIEEALNGKTLSEKEELRDSVFRLVPQGCKVFVDLMAERKDYDETSEADRFIHSPHGVSVVDALTLALALKENEKLTLEHQAELFASLAAILLGEIPEEMRWAVSTNKEFMISSPQELIEITVKAADAVNAINEARHIKNSNSVPEDKLAAKAAEVRTELAKLGADALHRENRAMRQQAYEWLSENRARFEYDTDAAEALGHVVPTKYTTRLDYVKAHKKMNKTKSE